MHGRTYIKGPWVTSNGFEVKVGEEFKPVVNQHGFVAEGAMNPAFMKVAKVPLKPGGVDSYAFAWQNPEDTAVLVHRVIVDVTKAGGTASSELDVGVVSGPESTADNIIDGLNINSTKVCDHLLVSGDGQGGVHKVDEKGGSNDYITGKIVVAKAEQLEGNAYIFYTAV